MPAQALPEMGRQVPLSAVKTVCSVAVPIVNVRGKFSPSTVMSLQNLPTAEPVVELVPPWLGDVPVPALLEVREAGLLELETDRIRLTARGRMVSNEVFSRLLIPSAA